MNFEIIFPTDSKSPPVPLHFLRELFTSHVFYLRPFNVFIFGSGYFTSRSVPKYKLVQWGKQTCLDTSIHLVSLGFYYFPEYK